MKISTEPEGRYRCRNLQLDGATISHLTVIDYQIRLLGAELKMAGIGGVYTHQEHKRKGHIRRLMAATVEYMTGEGYDVSMLFGIQDFYERFGFACSLPESTITVSTRCAERGERRCRPRWRAGAGGE